MPQAPPSAIKVTVYLPSLIYLYDGLMLELESPVPNFHLNVYPLLDTFVNRIVCGAEQATVVLAKKLAITAESNRTPTPTACHAFVVEITAFEQGP